MNPELAAPHSNASVAERAAARGGGNARLRGRAARLKASWDGLPRGWRLFAVATLGGLAAAGVGYTTSKNPLASPPGVAVELRVGLIAALVGAGVYAQTSRLQARMGG